MVTIKAGALADFVRDIFAKAGCSAAEAERIGKYLVSANLTGHDSHGVARVPRYLQWQREGVVVRRPHGQDRDRDAGAGRGRRPARLRPDGGAAGRRRSASTNAGPWACRWSRCATPGTSAASATGREMAAAAGLVSIHFVNASGSVLVAPFGGTRAPALHRTVRGRHSAPGADPDRARLRHLDRRRGQGAGGEPGRQEAARQRADRRATAR